MAGVLAGGRVVGTVAADVLGRLARVAHALLLLPSRLGTVGRDVTAVTAHVALWETGERLVVHTYYCGDTATVMDTTYSDIHGMANNVNIVTLILIQYSELLLSVCLIYSIIYYIIIFIYYILYE